MFEQPHKKGGTFTDTMAGQYKFLDRNRYVKLTINDSFFAAVYPMEKKSLSGHGLTEFIADFGVMNRLFCGGSKEQTSKGKGFIKGV